MRFFASATAVMAFATSAFAQTPDFDPVYTPKKGEVVPAGSTFEVTWSAPAKYADGTISISLIGGANDASLVPVADIASGIKNSDEKYSWEVDSALGTDALYGLVFKLESDTSIFQYSLPFQIKADDSAPTASGTGAVTTVTTAHGIKTVTLTSCPEVSTPPPVPTHAPNTTISTITTPKLNTTTYAPQPPPTTVLPTGPAPTEPAPTSVPTAAGAHLVTGPVAVIGGLAMALLAL